MLNLQTAARLLRQVLPTDEEDACVRWVEAARTFAGETAEIKALLSTAISMGIVSEEELRDLGLVEFKATEANSGRVVVLRRHGQPDRAGHLSNEGQASCGLLRNLSFESVLSSDLPRSVETAIAVGGNGREVFAELAPPPAHIESVVGSHQSFSHWVSQAKRDLVIAEYCQDLGAKVLGFASNDRTLVITHDDTIQAIAVGLLGDEASVLGRSVGYLEGIALFVDGTKSGVRVGSPPW